MKGPFAVQAAGGADTMRLRPNLCTETSQTARLARPGEATLPGACPHQPSNIRLAPCGPNRITHGLLTPCQARLDFRVYTTLGSVSTLTSAVFPDENARSSAGFNSSGRVTNSPCPPSASTTWS